MTLPEYFDKGIGYTEYLAAFEAAVAGKRTSGHIQTEDMARYTELNLTRMKRLYRHTELQPELKTALNRLDRSIRVICLTEFWCGDAAQNIPVLQLLAESSPWLEIRYLFRDENTALMDRSLTNGGRSIPKYIFFDAATGHESGHWGPRPQPSQQLMMDLKARNTPKAEIMEAIVRWYNHDKTLTLQTEWMNLLARWAA